jgi:lysozyme
MKTLPNPDLAWPIPLRAVELIAGYEGCRLKAYRCPAGKPTIGWGQTDNVAMGMTWTREEADADLCRSLTARTERVRVLCKRDPSDHELGALVSLHYNIGDAAFARSTALRQHNAGDALAASRAFGLFNKARVDGVLQDMPGLTARRAAEAALYLEPEDGAPSIRMPQAVEGQSSLAKSPIAQGGAVTAAAGASGLVTQAGDQVGMLNSAAVAIKTFVVGTLGLDAALFMPVLLIGLGGMVVWQRYGQRIKGWA